MNSFEKLNQASIGEIVTADFRSAEIFKKAGIDFCCGGDKNVEQACQEKGLDSILLINQIKELENSPVTGAQNFDEWELSFLADYIVQTHHRYVTKSLPELVLYTKKIASVHGAGHPELFEVEGLFLKISTELRQHLEKEEKILFPAIKEASIKAKPVILSEIGRMSIEHEWVGNAMGKIREITSNYLIPADACNTYQVTLKFLQQFEDDLHIHVHLENNILYKKALAI